MIKQIIGHKDVQNAEESRCRKREIDDSQKQILQCPPTLSLAGTCPRKACVRKRKGKYSAVTDNSTQIGLYISLSHY